ncbi:MAG: hypothetical protein KDC45_07915 [Bacteroidetes bacterium]|nr:hypothetical protein [Bacteroidota bacterium]
MKIPYRFLFLSLVLTPMVNSQIRLQAMAEKPRVALLPFDKFRFSGSKSLSDEEAVGLVDAAYSQCTNTFVNLKRLTVLERSSIDKLIKEQNFQVSELSNSNKAVSLGQFLGAQIVADMQIQSVTVKKDGDNFRAEVEMQIKLISVENGKLFVSTNLSKKGKSDKKQGSKLDAAMNALDKMEDELADLLRENFPIEANLIKRVPSKDEKDVMVLINCGSNMGIEPKDKFYILEKESITVGDITDTREIRRGLAKVVSLEPDGKYCIAKVKRGKKYTRTMLSSGQEIKVLTAPAIEPEEEKED